MRKFLTHSLRYYYYILAVSIIATAILLQTVRILAPQIDELRPSIEQFLSEQTGAQVSLGKLNASWYGLRPHVIVNDMLISNKDNVRLLSVKKADFSLDILQSIVNFQWTWKHVAFNQLHLNFEQDNNGHWQVAGFAATGNNKTSWQYRSPIELFSITPQVDISQVTAQVTFANQKSITVAIPSIQIENSKSFQRLSASAQIEDNNVLSLVLEREHNSIDKDVYARGFVKLTRFPLEHIVGALLNSAQKETDQDVISTNNSLIDSSLWFSFDHQGNFDFVGHIAPLVLDSIPFIGEDTLNLTAKTDLVGHYNFGQGWDIGLRNLVIDEEHFVKQLQLSRTSSNDVQLAIDRIELHDWSDWLDGKLEKSARAKSMLNQLSLQGDIVNVLVEIPEIDFDKTIIGANIHAVSSRPTDNIPGFQNINGYVESRLLNGFVNLSSDTFALFPKKIYNHPLMFNQVDGQIAWQLRPKENSIFINSNAIKANSHLGRATGYFLLDIPWQPGSRPSDFNLQIGIQDASSEHYQQVLPNNVPKQLTEWLASSLKVDKIPQAGFIYRGGFSDKKSRTFQVFLDVDQAELQTKDWPYLHNVQAEIAVDNNYVQVKTIKAEILDQNIENLSLIWPDDDNGALRVDVSSQLTAESGLRLLKESKLRETVGDTFDHWVATGNIHVNASIDIPVLDKPEAADPKQFVSIELLENTIELAEQKLQFDSTIGQINFSSEKGIYAESVQAFVFDRVLEISIKQENRRQQDEKLLISGEGSINADNLAHWLGSPEVMIVEGIIPYNFEMSNSINDKDKTIAINASSNFLGASIDLPEPFFHRKDEEILLNMSAVMKGDRSRYEITLGENISAVFASKKSETSGFLSINQQVEQVPKNTFSVFSSLETISVEQWMEALDRYQNKKDQFRGEIKKRGLPLNYDISAKTITYNDNSINDINISGSQSDNIWSATVNSGLIQGDIQFDDRFNSPIQLSLDYLNIPKDTNEKQQTLQVDPWIDIDFSTIKATNVSIKELDYKNKPIKNISFIIEGNDNSVVVENIKADFSGLLLGGIDTSTGAQLSWSKQDQQWLSVFKGRLSGGEIRSLSDDWQLPPIVESSNTAVDMDVSWDGSPAFFDIERLDGHVKFVMNDGIFLQNKQPSTTNALRFFSLINFNTWARRLRLDFSDLYKKGIVFDRMSSKLNFDSGKIYFQEPLHVESPSSEFTMAGVIDYPQHNIDAALITTLPIRGNLTFAAALAAGLPAAVGVYIVGKIFKPQVDKVSSLSYTVKGNWDDPKVTFVNLFGASDSSDDPDRPVFDESTFKKQ